MDLEEKRETGKVNENVACEVEGEEDADKKLSRLMSEVSVGGDAEEEEEELDADKVFDLGPQITLNDQMEKDKDDESLRRWKEQLLGSVDFNSVGDKLEPDVKILSLSILSPGREDLVLPIQMVPTPKSVWFTLKEGVSYRLKFTFSVSNNIVSGLKYTNTVWKTGVRVDRTKEMLGTFSPQLEPYTYETPDDNAPSGIFARGSYSARTKSCSTPPPLRPIHSFSQSSSSSFFGNYVKPAVFSLGGNRSLHHTSNCARIFSLCGSLLIISSSLMMMTNATWRSTTVLTSVGNGIQ